MAGEEVEYSANDLPDDLPLLDNIVKTCTEAGFCQNGVYIKVNGNPRYWTKYGGNVTLGEGLTQAYVAEIVNAESIICVPEVYAIFSRVRCRFIVMEYVSGTTFANRKSISGKYDRNEVQAVADAVKRLVSIEPPAGTAPGPIGGRIPHDFFLDFMSTLKYRTVEDLENHISAVITKLASPRTPRVDFRTETADGLILCLSDLDETNFMVDTTGKLWSIDFGHTCFLPPSFVCYSLKRAPRHFGRCVAYLVKYPESPNYTAMDAAAGWLVVTGNNSLCAPVARLQPGS